MRRVELCATNAKDPMHQPAPGQDLVRTVVMLGPALLFSLLGAGRAQAMDKATQAIMGPQPLYSVAERRGSRGQQDAKSSAAAEGPEFFNLTSWLTNPTLPQDIKAPSLQLNFPRASAPAAPARTKARAVQAAPTLVDEVRAALATNEGRLAGVAAIAILLFTLRATASVLASTGARRKPAPTSSLDTVDYGDPKSNGAGSPTAAALKPAVAAAAASSAQAISARRVSAGGYSISSPAPPGGAAPGGGAAAPRAGSPPGAPSSNGRPSAVSAPPGTSAAIWASLEGVEGGSSAGGAAAPRPAPAPPAVSRPAMPALPPKQPAAPRSSASIWAAVEGVEEGDANARRPTPSSIELPREQAAPAKPKPSMSFKDLLGNFTTLQADEEKKAQQAVEASAKAAAAMAPSAALTEAPAAVDVGTSSASARPGGRSLGRTPPSPADVAAGVVTAAAAASAPVVESVPMRPGGLSRAPTSFALADGASSFASVGSMDADEEQVVRGIRAVKKQVQGQEVIMFKFGSGSAATPAATPLSPPSPTAPATAWTSLWSPTSREAEAEAAAAAAAAAAPPQLDEPEGPKYEPIGTMLRSLGKDPAGQQRPKWDLVRAIKDTVQALTNLRAPLLPGLKYDMIVETTRSLGQSPAPGQEPAWDLVAAARRFLAWITSLTNQRGDGVAPKYDMLALMMRTVGEMGKNTANSRPPSWDPVGLIKDFNQPKHTNGNGNGNGHSRSSSPSRGLSGIENWTNALPDDPLRKMIRDSADASRSGSDSDYEYRQPSPAKREKAGP